MSWSNMELRYALLDAATRAGSARDARDDAALAHWRGRADEARAALSAALETDQAWVRVPYTREG